MVLPPHALKRAEVTLRAVQNSFLLPPSQDTRVSDKLPFDKIRIHLRGIVQGVSDSISCPSELCKASCPV